MYLPYLRGRQFELLALRELVEKNLIGNRIIPVIEPIKPTSTLIKTLISYSDSNKNIAVIMNPQVGNFLNDIRSLNENNKENSIYKSLKNIMKKENIIHSYIMTPNIIDVIKKKSKNNKFIVINNSRDNVKYYLDACSENIPEYTLISEERIIRRSVKKGRVLLDDKFNKQERNVDYMNNDDEFFSEEHLFYEEEGYSGFPDYSIVGEEFKESGFAPLAVAIHIVYFDHEKSLRIKHFVSDSNEDINDPAGKFGEALEKLISWIDGSHIQMTEGLKQFKLCYDTGKYPGLGTVKKLSIMHHIELINMYMQGEI